MTPEPVVSSPATPEGGEVRVKPGCPGGEDCICDASVTFPDPLPSPASPAETAAKEHAVKCPRCESPSPTRHPAVQFEGEVQVCPDPFHASTEDGRKTLAQAASPAETRTWEGLARQADNLAHAIRTGAEAAIIGSLIARLSRSLLDLSPSPAETREGALPTYPSPVIASAILLVAYLRETDYSVPWWLEDIAGYEAAQADEHEWRGDRSTTPNPYAHVAPALPVERAAEEGTA